MEVQTRNARYYHWQAVVIQDVHIDAVHVLDDIVVHYAGWAPGDDPSALHVNSLPPYSKGTFDIEVSVDTTQGLPDSIKLYYLSSTSSSFALYTDSSHKNGVYTNGEVIHFDSSLTGGALDYQFYSIASGGGTMEPQPSVADASTSVDMTSPQTTSSMNRTIMASGWYDGPVKVSLIGSDARSGVESIQYTLDGSTWATWGGDLNIDAEGAHNLTYHAVDKAGNVEDDHRISINIDGTAPMTSYSFDGAGKLSLLASDGASGPSSTRYRLDGGEWQTYSSPLDVLNAGHGSLEFYSTDNAGNAEAVRTVDLTNAPMGVSMNFSVFSPALISCPSATISVRRSG